MARLITHHDPYHVHKIQGLFILLHFLYRFVLLFYTGKMFGNVYADGKTRWEPLWLEMLCVGLHFGTSITSLLLPVPSKRNMSAQMIWNEFRAHNITFWSRHISMTLLFLWLSDEGNNAWFEEVTRVSHGTVDPVTRYRMYELADLLKVACAKAVPLAVTSFVASMITDRLGDRECRTTNAMPYPPEITDRLQKKVKLLYKKAQFTASIVSVLGSPDLAFVSLLGIQIWSFLMTLVRKGKIRALDYHRYYALALFLPYIAITSHAWQHVLVNGFDEARFDENGARPVYTYRKDSGFYSNAGPMSYVVFFVSAGYTFQHNIFRAQKYLRLPFNINPAAAWFLTMFLCMLSYQWLCAHFLSDPLVLKIANIPEVSLLLLVVLAMECCGLRLIAYACLFGVPWELCDRHAPAAYRQFISVMRGFTLPLGLAFGSALFLSKMTGAGARHGELLDHFLDRRYIAWILALLSANFVFKNLRRAKEVERRQQPTGKGEVETERERAQAQTQEKVGGA